jgi:hypothetical protein
MDELTNIVEEEGGKVVRSLGRRVVNAILEEQDLKTTGKHLVKEEILPWIGEKIRGMADRLIFEIFYPEGTTYTGKRNNRSGRQTNYTSYSDSGRRTNRSTALTRQVDTRTVSGDLNASLPPDLGPFEYGLLRWKTRQEAFDARMDILREWDESDAKAMSVNGLYNTLKYTTNNFKTADFGWTNRDDLTKIRVIKSNDGYWHLDIPKPIEFDD